MNHHRGPEHADKRRQRPRHAAISPSQSNRHRQRKWSGAAERTTTLNPSFGRSPQRRNGAKGNDLTVMRAATVAKVVSMPRAANTMWSPKRSPNTPTLSPSARHTNGRVRRGMSRHQPSMERRVLSRPGATLTFTQVTKRDRNPLLQSQTSPSLLAGGHVLMETRLSWCWHEGGRAG